jgi:O-antigen ligase
VLVVAVLPVVAMAVITGLRSPVRTLLCAYAAVVPFGSGIALPVPLPPPFNTLTSLLGLAAALAVAGNLAMGRRRGLSLAPMVPVALLYLAVCGITYAWSVNRSSTWDSYLVLISLVGLYVIVLLARLDEDDADLLGDAIAIGGALACGYGLYLLLTNKLPSEQAGLPRFSIAGGVGDDADPNITAATLVLPLVVAWDRVIAPRPPGRLLWAAAAGLITFGMLLTGSRGGMAGALLALLVLGLMRRRGAVRLIAALALVMSATYVVGSSLAPGQTERITAAGSSGRTSVWKLGLTACEQRCSWGSGLGTYLDVHEENFLSAPDAEGFRASLKAHNIWLQAGVETGVAGFVLLAALFALTVRQLHRLPGPRRAAPLGGVAGLLVTNLFLGNVAFKYFWLVLLYAGVMANAEKRATAATSSAVPTVDRSSIRTQRVPAGVIGVAVAAAIAAVVPASSSPTFEATALVVASRSSDLPQVRIGDLVEAVFENAGLDSLATVRTPADSVAFDVTSEGDSRVAAAAAANTAATELVDRFNLAGGQDSVLTMVNEAQPEVATRTDTPVSATSVLALAAIGGAMAAMAAAVVLAAVRRPMVDPASAARAARSSVATVAGDGDSSDAWRATVARLELGPASLSVHAVGRGLAGAAARLREVVHGAEPATRSVLLVRAGTPARKVRRAALAAQPVAGLVLLVAGDRSAQVPPRQAALVAHGP